MINTTAVTWTRILIQRLRIDFNQNYHFAGLKLFDSILVSLFFFFFFCFVRSDSRRESVVIKRKLRRLQSYGWKTCNRKKRFGFSKEKERNRRTRPLTNRGGRLLQVKHSYKKTPRGERDEHDEKQTKWKEIGKVNNV